MTNPNTRRGFLRGLTALPLIGGGVTLIGNPRGSGRAVTADLLDSYDTWLVYERRYLRCERYGSGSGPRWVDGRPTSWRQDGPALRLHVRAPMTGGQYHGHGESDALVTRRTRSVVGRLRLGGRLWMSAPASHL